MEPDDVAKKYAEQARLLFNFTEKLKEQKFTEAELRVLLEFICANYYDLLVNLAFFTPYLNQYSVKFYQVKPLGQQKIDLNKPPFDEEYFNSKRI